MPPSVALVLTILLIAYLYWKGFESGCKPSLALWIPTAWFLILMSRPVTAWVNLSSAGTILVGSSEDLLEGSPIDRAVMLVLILLGVAVLWSRHLAWGDLFRKNGALTAFFLYCGVSIFWSDFPFVAFKRWTKGLGDPIMILVILTDPAALRAVEIVIRRCAYLIIPLSVLFIKYYPEYGKVYDEWTGYGMYTGVTMNKNLLGFDLMVVGLFFAWKLLLDLDSNRSDLRKRGMLISIGMLLMVGWLFNMANSQTSLLSCLLAFLIVLILGISTVRRRAGTWIILGLVMVVILDVTLDFRSAIAGAVGRNMTLTGRVDIWESVLNKAVSPIYGAGFESFWLGKRLEQVWAEFAFKPNQAHNGYIEVYLNLGILGLISLAGVLVASYLRLRKMLASDVAGENVNFGRLGLGFLIAYLVYNYTEAAFKSLHFMFLIFLLFAIRPPKALQGAVLNKAVVEPREALPQSLHRPPRVT